MTVSSLIHPIRLLKKIEPSNHTNNHEKHQTHNSIKKQHSKDFGDAMQQALSKDNPVFISLCRKTPSFRVGCSGKKSAYLIYYAKKYLKNT